MSGDWVETGWRLDEEWVESGWRVGGECLVSVS